MLINDTIRIDDQLTVASNQINEEQLKQAAKAGFKSVLNLRSPTEPGFLQDKQQQVEAFGLQYLNLPVNPEQITNQLTVHILMQMNQLAKPILLHCSSGIRSGAMALIYVAVHRELTVDQAIETSHQLGLNLAAKPKIQQFVKDYIANYSPTVVH